MRWFFLLCLFPLGACTALLGDAPDIDYDKVIVPVVTECYQPSFTADQNKQYAISVMEVGFTKVRAACESFFVGATRVLQNQIMTDNTLNAGLAGAQSIFLATSSAASAAKAIAVTTAGVTFGKALADQIASVYAFGTHLPKIRQIANDSMDQYVNLARQSPPSNACYAYSLVQQLALKCTLAALADIDNQQNNIPSKPALPADLVVSNAVRGMPNGSNKSLVPRSSPSVGVTVVPYNY
ncbi:hypothetical protein [Bradyrhizobium sp. USDA 4502]